MSQVLGIDIGSYTIKFAFLEIEKSNVILKNVIETPIPVRAQADEEKLAKIQILRHVLGSVNLTNLKDNIYAGLGSQYTVLQNFDFLKVSAKNLPKIIANEFDELGLFSLEDYLIELKILEKTSKKTRVLGMLIKKLAARDVIEILSEAHLTARIIDIECLAFQNLIPYTPQFTDSENEQITTLIVNIGHSKTSVLVIENEQVVLERSFNLAGKYITSQIQNECNLSFEAAQVLKHNVSGNIDFSSEYSQKAKSILQDCCLEIAKELERIVLGFTRTENAKKIDSVLITGGTAKVTGFAKIIEGVVSIPTENLNLSNPNFKNAYSDPNVFESFAQAIALGLRGTSNRSNSDINIRHGELALVSDYENVINSIFFYTKIISITAVCLLGTYFLRSYLYNKKINEIKNLFNTQISAYFGTEPKELKILSLQAGWDFNNYSKTGLNLINRAYQERVNFIENIYSEKSIMPLVVLSDISAEVPKSLYFEVIDYKYQDGLLNIQAETDSKESLEKIVSLISSIKRIKNVQKKSDAMKPGTNLISFSLVATVQSKEGG